MKIVTPADNGPRAHQPGHGISMHDNRRRHDHLTRRVTFAREAGMFEAALPENSKSKVANAARALVQSYQLGKVSRQQIEEEQRADETRLKGWEAVKPQPGTVHEAEIPKIRYRMAVRARALEEIASLDLAVMIGSTARNQKARPPTPAATPWRSGTGHGTGGAKRGKPIGLREANPCHEPAGSDDGGQFARKGSGNCSGGGETARDRAAGISDAKKQQYALDRVGKVMDYFDAQPKKPQPKTAVPRDLEDLAADEAGKYWASPEGQATKATMKSTMDARMKAEQKVAAPKVDKQADWRAESARLEQKYGTDDGRGPIDEYKGVPVYTLRSYTTPYYYIARKDAPYHMRNKVGSVNHSRSFKRIQTLIDKIKAGGHKPDWR